jgi:hypothetical protein
LKKTIILFLALMLLFTSYLTVISSPAIKNSEIDLDPLVNVEVTVEIECIRFLEDDASEVSDYNSILFPFRKKSISTGINPNMYLKIFINNIEFVSNIWYDTKYIYDSWTATLDIPDEEEFVDIKIQLWSSIIEEPYEDRLCDISGDIGNSEDGYDVELTYSIKTGYWSGDDKISEDPSGYGRLCGCDDGTSYTRDRDCEIWFNIYQNDFDNDNIPYWTEVNDYGTNPEISNIGEDLDNDDIPIEWEWKWRYDPFTYNNHKEIDTDQDSLDNYEEFLTSEWRSDPFRKDVFVEIDLMEEGPNGEISEFPTNSEELINTAFNKQNIVFHLDFGTMGGHEIIPFDDLVEWEEFHSLYYNYFLHGSNNNWRRGVFHYGLVVYSSVSAAGFMFRRNAFQISTSGHNIISERPDKDRDIVFASAYMHELGHTFGIFPLFGHNSFNGIRGIIYWLFCRSYKSCMNYGWIYTIVDYSDGSRRFPDVNDWDNLRYGFFEIDW